MTDATKTATKTRGKPFQKGNRANPNGRPAGSRNKATIMLDRMAEADAKAVLQKQLEKAKEGDAKAAEMILSRVWPARKGRTITLNLPPLEKPADIVAALGAVADAVAVGQISPDEAQAVAAVLETKRRAIETTDLEKRIETLEAERKNK
jgi:hypothetical protein